jgi:hypothetical protein
MIYPKCKNTDMKVQNVIGCRQDGTIIPCCFFGSNESFNEIAELLGDDVKNINLKSGKTIEEINRSEEFQRIEATWNTDNPLPTCQGVCSSEDFHKNNNLGVPGNEQ